jgi:hypothetical protein
MISAQTRFRVCREGKPLHTFPDHALACAPEFAGSVAGDGGTLHANFAHVDALVELLCVIVRESLGDACTLFAGVLHFLRTRRKSNGE